ncbi:ELKS/Rab6-interacting/CAST family member 1-like [Balaenoptera acutorostrata]|uniref:ELKS/Rab6-interacting/CAST family member 1-like n=1 Tax=Balaenoptera acutorostrata TaxID=9767 RepID=A0ABM3T0B4_BALAC|nr:ELKS/Rab6-interacting/CAST family member 1-like [Balaenoptera acutorostrata]
MAMEKVKQELESVKATLSCTQQSLAEKETHVTNLRAERRKHLEEVLEMNILPQSNNHRATYDGNLSPEGLQSDKKRSFRF